MRARKSERGYVYNKTKTTLILRLKQGGTTEIPLKDEYMCLRIGQRVNIVRSFTKKIVNVFGEETQPVMRPQLLKARGH